MRLDFRTTPPRTTLRQRPDVSSQVGCPPHATRRTADTSQPRESTRAGWYSLPYKSGWGHAKDPSACPSRRVILGNDLTRTPNRRSIRRRIPADTTFIRDLGKVAFGEYASGAGDGAVRMASRAATLV